MKENFIVAVLGSGSWATAIVKLLQNNIQQIHWYIRNEDTIDYIKKYNHNPKYVSSIDLDTSKIIFHSSVSEAIESANLLIFAIPSPFLRDTLSKYTKGFENKIIVSAVKGIVPQLNLTIAEFFNKEFCVPFKNTCIVSGPCHAEEIALERLSYLTVASSSKQMAEAVADLFRTHYVNVNTSKDIYGIEYAAVLKNVMAIAAGICHGLGYGDNFIAVLIANASREIKRFLDKTYKSKRKVNSSAYFGDLLVTSYSQFSRNRSFGTMLGKGYSVKSAQIEMEMIAEGYYATSCLKEINKIYNVKMPILDAVYHILHDKVSPALEIKLLTEKLK